MLGPGKLDISKWVLKSMIFVALFDRFFVEFMFNFASWPGRPDKRRAHTEHTQSTHRAHTEHTQNTHRAHTEHTQSTHRARTEPTQSAHRAHTEHTQSTHRAYT